MRHRSVFVAAMGIALIGAGCASTPAYNPFKIPQAELYGKIKTIALASVSVPRGLENPWPVRAKFESLVEAKLREAGFSIVSAREYERIAARFMGQEGGFFDPVTGQPDQSKIKKAREQIFRELHTRFNADALLVPVIEVVRVEFRLGLATWDGASQHIDPSAMYQGVTSALSLVISLQDIQGGELYLNRGGIQTLRKLSRGEFVSVPPGELFANEERNVAAANIALGPLIRKTSPTGKSG